MRPALGITAGALGATAVAFGALGAHALQGRLDAAALTLWHTAVEYQFWHALALFGVAGLASARAARIWCASGIAFGAGSALFCGSLYALALGAPHWLGAVTPFGGAVLILGWLLLGAAFWCSAASQ